MITTTLTPRQVRRRLAQLNGTAHYPYVWFLIALSMTFGWNLGR